MGGCTCDVTLNSCDTYCCCDTDCPSEILNFWNANYNTYCTKNYIGSAYSPLEKCVDQAFIYDYNKRMGMEISEANGQLCVELDTGSVFSNYENYIPSFSGQPSSMVYDLSSTLYT